MAFKMRCPKCFGLDYSIERDNRTFGAVAQAFELVFHCRCGKQLFGDQLLKEYELQKKDYEVRGPDADAGGALDSRSRRQDDEIRERLEQRNKRQGAPASDHAAGEDSEEDDPRPDDDDRPTEDKRWRQRMAALAADTGDDDDDDDEDETPAPARSRAARSVAPKSTRTEPRTVVTESAPEAKPAARTEAKVAPAKAKAPPKEPPAPKEAKVKAPPRPKAEKATKAAAAPAPAPVAPPARAEAEPEGDHDHDHEDDDEDDEDLEGEERDESEDEDGGDGTICAWPGCTNPRRPNSKYCSRACSNKNARSRHKGRVKKPGKKGNQAAA